MNNLAVLILGGGNGTRFWPISTDKLLLPFREIPFIHRRLPECIPTDATVIAVTNTTNNQFFQTLPIKQPIKSVIQEHASGMADAILSAESHIRDHSLLILIADDIFDSSLVTDVLKKAEASHTFGIIPGWKTPSYFPGGYMVLEDQRIKKIIEKPKAGEEPSEYVVLSCHFIRDANLLIDQIKNTTSDHDDVYETALSTLMKDHEFLLQPYEHQFFSLKYPWNILDVMDVELENVKDSRGENIVMKDHVIIEGPVSLGNNVKIMEFSKIVGPCVIGDNTIIGNNNVIRHSMIGNNCVTGFSTDITRSYIGNDCWFHTNYIGDSVLEGNCSMGSGTVLANLRLDEGEIYSKIKGKKTGTNRNKLGAIIGKNVRIGVNTSIMPGIKIGRNSCISAGITVDTDIPEDTFVRGNYQFECIKNTAQITSDRTDFKNKI